MPAARPNPAEITATRPAPHERILEVARELFCRDGIHATGIDRILAEANASKMTLYSRFGSKEALLREVLAREGEAQRALVFATIEAAGPDPVAARRRPPARCRDTSGPPPAPAALPRSSIARRR